MLHPQDATLDGSPPRPTETTTDSKNYKQNMFTPFFLNFVLFVFFNVSVLFSF